MPITTVQKILGHTDVSTTQRYAEIGRDTIARDLLAAGKTYKIKSPN